MNCSIVVIADHEARTVQDNLITTLFVSPNQGERVTTITIFQPKMVFIILRA